MSLRDIMNVDARLQLSMSQKLVMTPMLQQAIKLLQMSRLELVDLVKQELLENPVLDEVDEVEQYLRQEEPVDKAESDLAGNTLQVEQMNSDFDIVESSAQNNQGDSTVSWEDYFADNPAGLGHYGEKPSSDLNQSYENFVSQSQSLAEHLSWQLQMSRVPEQDMKIGRFLIGQIDANGYLQCDDETSLFLSDLHKTGLDPKQLEEYRAHVVDVLCQKINAAFEREFISAAIDTSNIQGFLAHTLLQEYNEDIMDENYQLLVDKLRYLTLKDLEIITKALSEFSSESLEALTHVPASEIRIGLHSITKVCSALRQFLERHYTVITKGKYEVKLEKTGLSSEELYLLEYFLLQLSAEEIAYIASKENAAKAAKREKDVQSFLKKLQQSYAHIENLQSRKYFLIQLYRVGVGLLIEKLKSDCPVRFQKLFLKLINVTIDDVKEGAKTLSLLTAKYYENAVQVSCEEVERTLRHIQTFAPPGVGARDLKECLTIQARNLGITDTAVEPIIHDYLTELEQGQHAKIAEQLGISLEEVELVAKIISNMSPNPGADFATEQPEYIIPDIYVYNVGEEYEVVLNEDDLPYLRINPVYKKLITGNNHEIPHSTKQYVDQKLRSAIWFIRSVEQRKRTIYKVGKSIVKFQKEFLDHGVSHLKPLVLRDVADDISMHESTVSRVTTNKYIHTPQGVFELKFFFHSGLESSSGHDVSSIAVKERIKKLIVEEDNSRPLSDKTIENILQKEGIAIARRTIAKYREELNIPSSIQRKSVAD
jgi:RNA polymerase sigma-54 factor